MHGTPTPPVCEKTKPKSIHPWRCVRAAGHDDDCKWPIESEHYDVPLSGRTAEWLASEVRCLLYRVEAMKRDHHESTARTDRLFGRLMAGLVQLAPATSKRKNVPTADVQRLWQEARG